MNERITFNGPDVDGQDRILTDEAMDFVLALHDVAVARRQELLHDRKDRRRAIENGRDPKFLDETASIREDDSWRVAPLAPGLEDRRVEITGPTERKMTINALNSGAKVWLADLEDANTPRWDNVIGGQVNLLDATDGTIEYTSPEGKEYRVTAETTPTVIVRPRGWHLAEKHLLVDGAPIAGGVLDFGLHFFHNAKKLISQGRGPYYYLPKLEGHLEARLWNDLFVKAQDLLGVAQGTIRATVLIETITAAFEMEEILYELRNHSAGLNAGRWDYIFSVIKNFRHRGPRFVMPDRNEVTMTQPFMRIYTEQLVRACHRRGASAIGGMSAFIPSKDAAVNEVALAKVKADKEREAADGFDGSWVAHPGLVPVCLEAFDAVLGDRPNQIDKLREDVEVDGKGLIDLSTTTGEITDAGVRANISVALRYIESWLRGNGAAAIDNLMEDAATAEISRSQIWQWIQHRSVTREGTTVTRDWVAQIVDEEIEGFDKPEGNRFGDARALFEQVAMEEEFPTFLTVPGYVNFLCEVPVGA